VITRETLPLISKEVIKEKLDDVNGDLVDMQLQNEQVQKQLNDEFACENPKLLEYLIEHIVIHWDDISEVLIDELLEEEAIELNRIEDLQSQGQKKKRETKLADRSMSGKFHDYKTADLRDIMQLFEEYKTAESSIKNRL